MNLEPCKLYLASLLEQPSNRSMDKWRKWATVVHRTSAYIQFLSSIVVILSVLPYLWVKRAECGLSSVCYHPLNSRTTRNDNTYSIFDPCPADEGNTNQNDDIWSWGSHTFLVDPWASAATVFCFMSSSDDMVDLCCTIWRLSFADAPLHLTV